MQRPHLTRSSPQEFCRRQPLFEEGNDFRLVLYDEGGARRHAPAETSQSFLEMRGHRLLLLIVIVLVILTEFLRRIAMPNSTHRRSRAEDYDYENDYD